MNATAPATTLPHTAQHVKPRAVETLDFNGVALQTLPPNGDGKAWVSIRHVCDALGVSNQGQQAKLATKEWACVKMILTQIDGDDQTRSIACIDLDSLPMWLATIEASRVKPEVRPLLLAFQRDCARVLRDHYYGVKPAAVAAPAVAPIATPAARPLPAPSKKADGVRERGNRTLWPGLPNDTASAAERMTDAAFQLSCLYGHRRDVDGKVSETDATEDDRQAVEAADLHAIGQLAEAMAEEVRRRWPALVGLMTVRRLPRARQHALALAAGVK